MKKATIILGLGAALAIAACGGDDDEHKLEEEICTHLTGGPFEMVTATSSAAGAPDISTAHTAHQITIASTGFVTYQAGEKTDFAIALDADVPVKVTQAGATVAIEKSETPTDAPCTELKVIKTVELDVGTATIEIGPTTATTVTVIVEEAAHEEHEGH